MNQMVGLWLGLPFSEIIGRRIRIRFRLTVLFNLKQSSKQDAKLQV